VQPTNYVAWLEVTSQ